MIYACISVRLDFVGAVDNSKTLIRSPIFVRPNMSGRSPIGEYRPEGGAEVQKYVELSKKNLRMLQRCIWKVISLGGLPNFLLFSSIFILGHHKGPFTKKIFHNERGLTKRDENGQATSTMSTYKIGRKYLRKFC